MELCDCRYYYSTVLYVLAREVSFTNSKVTSNKCTLAWVYTSVLVTKTLKSQTIATLRVLLSRERALGTKPMVC